MREFFVTDAGDMRYEISPAHGAYPWRVLRSPGELVWSGQASTLEEAKAQIVVSSGRKPDGEWKVLKVGARTTSGDIHIDIRWIHTQWEWKVSNIRTHEVIGPTASTSFEEAKANALKAAGLERADWAEIV
jgi:hypothetical protein